LLEYDEDRGLGATVARWQRLTQWQGIFVLGYFFSSPFGVWQWVRACVVIALVHF
jgi:hypothetical protein